MHNPESVLENETHKLLWDFEIYSAHLILGRKPDLIIINKEKKKKKRTCEIVDFAVPADHRVKLKESQINDKYLDLDKELKKKWNMEVTVISIIISALGTVVKRLVQGLSDLEIRGQVKTIPTTALMRSVRILRRVLETCGDLLSLKPL